MDFMQWLLTAQIPVAGSALLVREVVGNAFGLASALGGMTRHAQRASAALRTAAPAGAERADTPVVAA
ncbi:hypothetical protein SCMU_19010 [Sinomonas cyclohexanicum]|uniref:Uncharacterized protein n=1 Tax=Sinomonas cyclohexanicum TaxID=322009 RepID=A0ABM7PVE1_SINCY|nr:hypothetical protein [Corynebacterium cyclohexanicum]BCT76059.1 hypothetical protein SCMU_19010 [Corynebacterium cyclohexanicum]